MKSKTIVLEPSTNTHALSANEVKSKTLEDGSTMVMKVTGEGIVSHSEHGTLVTESQDVVKYVQQEYNPVTKAMQNAFD